MTEVLRGLPAKAATDRVGDLHPLSRRHRLGGHRRGRRPRRLGRPGAPGVPVGLLQRAFPGSFARGELFNPVAATGDSRISGTFASLAGLEAALEAGDPGLVDDAIARIRLGHALIMAWDGVPLIYMGDELGLLNDRSYVDDPAHVGGQPLAPPSGAWTGRRPNGATDRSTVEGRIFADLVRPDRRPSRHAPAPRGDAARRRRDSGDPGVLAHCPTSPGRYLDWRSTTSLRHAGRWIPRSDRRRRRPRLSISWTVRRWRSTRSGGAARRTVACPSQAARMRGVALDFALPLRRRLVAARAVGSYATLSP